MVHKKRDILWKPYVGDFVATFGVINTTSPSLEHEMGRLIHPEQT